MSANVRLRRHFVFVHVSTLHVQFCSITSYAQIFFILPLVPEEGLSLQVLVIFEGFCISHEALLLQTSGVTQPLVPLPSPPLVT